MPDVRTARSRWRTSQRVTSVLLAVWFATTFGIAFFARELNGRVWGWPFSFWVAAQGAPLVYLVIVCIYARRMNRLDREHGLAGDD